MLEENNKTDRLSSLFYLKI